MGHLHGYRARLCSAPPEPSAQTLKQARDPARLWRACFSFLFCQGDRRKEQFTAFLVQLTNCMLAQFSLSTISQSKSNPNSQTGICFLKFINPVCLFHLYRLLLLYYVLNQRKEHEFWFCFLVVLGFFFSSSKVSTLQGYKYLISEWKFHWLTQCN